MELRRDISSSVRQFSKVFKVSLACLLLAALAWAGGDPWKSKPYQQWDANDMKKVFSDSPWSKVVQISATWKPAQSSEGSAPAEPQSSGAQVRGRVGSAAARHSQPHRSQPRPREEHRRNKR